MSYLTRREFALSALAAGALSACSSPAPNPAIAQAAPISSKPPRRLRILVLGGTRFVGPAIVRAALARGHEVSLFNRGQTRPWLFPGVEQLRGNRYPGLEQGLKALEKRSWDAVIDVPAYFPSIVEASAALLTSQAAHYLMISSISVYQDFKVVGLTETAAVRALKGEYSERVDLSEDWDFATYGARKVLCEQAAERHFPGRCTVLRACGIAGGGLSDPSKWVWPARLARMPVVAAAGSGAEPMQIVDRADIADFAIRALEQQYFGIYNLASPRMPFRKVLETMKAAVHSEAKILWSGEAGRELLAPLPAPAPEARVPGFAAISSEKARSLGFSNRPLLETVKADWLWFREHHPLNFDFHKAGHAPDTKVEAELIAKLRASG